MLPSPAKWDLWMSWWDNITWLLQVAFYIAQAPKLRIPGFQSLSVTSPFRKVWRQRDLIQIVSFTLNIRNYLFCPQRPHHGKSARSDHPSLTIPCQVIWRLPADESRSCSRTNSHVLLCASTSSTLISQFKIEKQAKNCPSPHHLSQRKGRGWTFQPH